MKQPTIWLATTLCGLSMIVPATGAPKAGASLPADADGAAPHPLPERAEQMLRKRQEEMIEMHDLMHRIRDAKDPKEKARLMDQHLQMLRDSWQEMRAQRRHRPPPGARRGGQRPGGDGDGDMPAPGDAP